MAQITAEPTPNPDSLKFTAAGGQFRDDGVAAFSSAADAEEDPLAQRLFRIPDVADVFVTPTFVTVSKHSDAEWTDTKAEVEAVLTDYLTDAA